MIHRDLKPDNIFLDQNSNVKIGDFGLARAFHELMPPTLSRNGSGPKKGRKLEQSGVVGTPLYFSPEQTDLFNGGGKNQKVLRELDDKIDIYALGLILLELSTNIKTSHEK
jgi:serine/threonine protein kinase